MSFSGDPFRVLGLPAGAGEDEIKRAYRALAKRYHPDSAGEAALPRFLAIQAAYDLLTGGAARPKATPQPGGTARPSGPDSAQARASREAYRARRATPPPPRDPPAGGWWAGGRAKDPGRTNGGGAAEGGTGGPNPAGVRPSKAAGTGTAPGAGADAGTGAGAGTGANAGAGANAGNEQSAGVRGSRPPSGTRRGAGSPSAGGSAAPRATGRPGASGRRGTGAGSTGTSSEAGSDADLPPAGDAAASGAPGSDDARDDPPRGPHGRRGRTPKVATLGSTSYDDAPAEREPSWSGATWYGGSSGTYWTLNPKEYADPRKHGPEYLARARRGASGTADGAPVVEPDGPVEEAPGGSAEDPQAEARTTAGDPPSTAGGASGPGVAADGPEPATDGLPRAGTTTARPPRVPRGAGWRYQQSTPTDPWRPRRPSEPRARTAPLRESPFDDRTWPGDVAPGRATRAGPEPPPPAGPGLDAAADLEREQSGRAFDWTGLDSRVPRRLLLAALAWPPLGYVAGAVIGEATGCGRYAATCSDAGAALGTLIQPLIVLVLVLLPVLARPAAVASIATGVAAIAGAVLLSISGGARVPLSVSAPFLIAILVLGYAVGLAIAFSRRLSLPPWLARGD